MVGAESVRGRFKRLGPFLFFVATTLPFWLENPVDE